MKTKTERYNFTFNKKTSALIKKIADKTDLSYTKIVEKALETYAKIKEIL